MQTDGKKLKKAESPKRDESPTRKSNASSLVIRNWCEQWPLTKLIEKWLGPRYVNPSLEYVDLVWSAFDPAFQIFMYTFVSDEYARRLDECAYEICLTMFLIRTIRQQFGAYEFQILLQGFCSLSHLNLFTTERFRSWKNFIRTLPDSAFGDIRLDGLPLTWRALFSTHFWHTVEHTVEHCYPWVEWKADTLCVRHTNPWYDIQLHPVPGRCLE